MARTVVPPVTTSREQAVARSESTPGEDDAALGFRLSPRFGRRVTTIPPGERRAYVEAEWRDSIVLVEQGQIELECAHGGRRRFGRGDLLWFVDLDLRFVHGTGTEPAVLVAISRRAGGG
jgi:hypothetical protein